MVVFLIDQHIFLYIQLYQVEVQFENPYFDQNLFAEFISVYCIFFLKEEEGWRRRKQKLRKVRIDSEGDE